MFLCFRHDDKSQKDKNENYRFFWKYQDISSESPFTISRTVVKQCQYGKAHKRSNGESKSAEVCFLDMVHLTTFVEAL